MILKQAHINSVWPHRHEFHVLTYAEEGFAPLNEHTKNFGITKEQLVAFAHEINARNAPGSLHPVASVSAVPRTLLRDHKNAEALCMCIEEFYKINAIRIHAKKILLDFRTPNVERFVQRAVEMSLRSEEVNFIDELIVIDDDAT